MIRYFCDSCNKELDEPCGGISFDEFPSVTVANGIRVTIRMEIDDDKYSLCRRCLWSVVKKQAEDSLLK